MAKFCSKLLRLEKNTNKNNYCNSKSHTVHRYSKESNTIVRQASSQHTTAVQFSLLVSSKQSKVCIA